MIYSFNTYVVRLPVLGTREIAENNSNKGMFLLSGSLYFSEKNRPSYNNFTFESICTLG